MKNRKLNRLSNYDYSQQGMYFITVCTKDREHLFGEIVNGEMNLNDAGKIIQYCLTEIPGCFPNIFIDENVIMPNHLHFIIENVGVRFIEPKNNTTPPNTQSGFDKSNPYKKIIKNNPMLNDEISLGKIIRHFKAKSSTEIRKHLKYWKFSWQRNYYDRIIRNEIELNKIREYIFKNPQNWEHDRNNSKDIFM